MLALNMYRLREVGSDYIILEDNATDIRITFADGSGSPIDTNPPTTKEENAQFFRHIRCQVGLEVPVGPLREPHKLNIFLDHFVDGFGWLRSTPFPFPVSQITVGSKTP